MSTQQHPDASEATGVRSDQAGSEVTAIVPPTSDTADQLAEYRRWLIEHQDDPQLVAGCARLGRLLGGVA